MITVVAALGAANIPATAAALALAPAAQQVSVHKSVAISVKPQPALIERTRHGQALNFDFELANGRADEVEIRQVNLSVYDKTGALLQKLELNDNGLAPGIETIPSRKIVSGGKLLVFNPFHTLASELPIARLDYEFVLRGADKKRFKERATVRPQLYQSKTRLQLPLGGRVLVWDGHDFNSHHRRVDLGHFFARAIGATTNAGRYALDLVVIDEAGEMAKGDSKVETNHYAFGKPVYAPGDGIVVAAVDNVSKAPIGPEEIKKNRSVMAGNHVVIDHGNGEFSHIAHLHGISVKVGQRVRAGERIGSVGNSGLSLFPHVHYQLVTTADESGEGLPAYFHGFERVLGFTRREADGEAIDSGDIVQRRVSG